MALRKPRWMVWVGVFVGAAALAMSLAAMLYAPGPPKLTLTTENLTIHDFFSPLSKTAGCTLK